MNPERLLEIEAIATRATPAPWGPYRSNLPFYAEVLKPAPSLSQHDSEMSTYWKIEDAQFVALAREAVPELIDEVKRLRQALRDIATQHSSPWCAALAQRALEGK